MGQEALELKSIWKQFVTVVTAHIDPVLASILHSTDIVDFNRTKNIVEIITLKKFVLFQDLFITQKSAYQQSLNTIFGYQVTLVVHFTKIEVAQPAPVVSLPASDRVASAPVGVVGTSKAVSTYKQPYKNFNRKEPTHFMPVAKNEKAIDISDSKKWHKTHALLNQFGGTVREIIKDTDEFNA